MPPHYAITEAFITLAAIWCAWKLFPRGQWMGAVGVLMFGAAAAIGVYRFPSGQVEELARLHFMAGQLGGLVGMGFIAAEFLRNAVGTAKRSSVMMASLALIALCFVVAILKPALSVPLFLLWSVAAIIGAFASAKGGTKARVLAGVLVSIMLLNVIFIRKSPAMSADISWHAFHAITAVWVVIIGVLLLKLAAPKQA
ncbi:MAG: hypothetical protein ACPGVT_00385 [Maricaulaceae bacterium]